MNSIIDDFLETDDFAALSAAKALIEARLDELRDAQIFKLKKHVIEQTDLLGVTPAQLFLEESADGLEEKQNQSETKARKVGAPKYQDAATGATWSGKGKAPSWMKAYLEAGGAKEDLLIRAPE